MKRLLRTLLAVLIVFALCFSLASCAVLLDQLSGIFGEDPGAQPPTPTDGELAVHFIDVDQADAILIVDGDKTMLIDTGDRKTLYKEFMLDYIQDLGITKIDYLVLTHPDADHIGGAPEVINTFNVANCIMPAFEKTTKIFQDTVTALEENEVNVILPTPGDDYTLKNATFRILAPIEDNYEDTNDHSIVLRLQYGQRSILFTGDAEKISEEDMVQKYGTGTALKSDVLKVGHHGSRTSTSAEFLSLVDPDYAVISCGVDNSYQHPHDETIDRLNVKGIPLYRTDLDGSIVLLTDGEELNFTKLGKENSAKEAFIPSNIYILIGDYLRSWQ